MVTSLSYPSGEEGGLSRVTVPLRAQWLPPPPAMSWPKVALVYEHKGKSFGYNMYSELLFQVRSKKSSELVPFIAGESIKKAKTSLFLGLLFGFTSYGTVLAL